MGISEKYPELTAEEYRDQLNKLFDKIQYTQALRYFYVFVSEKIEGHGEVFLPDHMHNFEEVING